MTCNPIKLYIRYYNMSGIDKLLKDLENIPDTSEKIEIKIKEVKEQIKELPEIDDNKELEKIRKEVRKKIKDLEKQAGKEIDPAKQITKTLRKAKGTGGGNDGGVRCYIRYNNRGNPYRICDDGQNPANKKKPPSVITPAIDPEDFAEKFGGYANLSKEQQRTYHRLYMRRVRKENQAEAEAGEGVANVLRAQRRVAKEKARVEKLEAKQKKLEKNDKIFKFRAEMKNYSSAVRGGQKSRLLKKYGLSPEDIGKKKAGTKLKENIDDVKQAQANIETEQEFIDKNIKELEGGGIEVKSSGEKTILTFD